MTCPCVFITNEAYVPYLGIVMQSVIENASAGNKYIFHVFYRELRPETMERFKNHIRKYPNFSIEFIDASSYIEGRKLHISSWVPEVYFKQLAPYVLTGYDKLLYLDSDVVVNIDVAQFFEMDLGGKVLAAGRDMKGIGFLHAARKKFGEKFPKKFKRDRLGIHPDYKNPDDYVNTGVLLFNAPAFRSEINFDELMDASARECPGADQDLFNTICEGKIHFLPIKYHFQEHYWGCSTYLPERFRAEYAEAKENPAVLHLQGKPWKFVFNTWFSVYFWAYAVRSPFFNELRRQMRDKGFISDYAENSIGEYIKNQMKAGKKDMRPALTAILKAVVNTIYRTFLR